MGKQKNRNRDTAKPKSREEMNRRLIELHGGDCKAALRTLLKTMNVSRYELIRDFCVIDMHGQGAESPTAIYYVPDLAIRSLDLSYELVVGQIKSKPQEDLKLMEMILLGEHRAEPSSDDARAQKHLEGVKFIERLCRDCGFDVDQIVKAGNFPRYQRVRDWYIVDVRNLDVHAPTMVMTIPGAEWILSETAFNVVLDALDEEDHESDARFLNAIKAMSRDDRRYRTVQLQKRT